MCFLSKLEFSECTDNNLRMKRNHKLEENGLSNICVLILSIWWPWTSQVIFWCLKCYSCETSLVSLTCHVIYHRTWHVSEEGSQWDWVHVSVQSAFRHRFWWEQNEVRLYKLREEHCGAHTALPNANTKPPRGPAVDNLILKNWKMIYFISSILLTHMKLIDSEYFFSHHVSSCSQL